MAVTLKHTSRFKLYLLILSAFLFFSIVGWLFFFERQLIMGDTSKNYFKTKVAGYQINQKFCGMLGCMFGSSENVIKIPEADPDTFQVIFDNPDYHYVISKDKNHLFLASEAQKVDLNNLKIKDNYMTDGINIYYQGHKHDEFDVSTFEVIGDKLVKDINGLYQIVNSFSISASAEHTGLTQRTVLVDKIDIIDKETFVFHEKAKKVGNSYVQAEDKNLLYNHSTGSYSVVEKANDKVDFKRLDCSYSSMNGKVYYGLKEVKGADTKNFTPLNKDTSVNFVINNCESGNYGWDGKNYYFQGILVNKSQVPKELL